MPEYLLMPIPKEDYDALLQWIVARHPSEARTRAIHPGRCPIFRWDHGVQRQCLRRNGHTTRHAYAAGINWRNQA